MKTLSIKEAIEPVEQVLIGENEKMIGLITGRLKHALFHGLFSFIISSKNENALNIIKTKLGTIGYHFDQNDDELVIKWKYRCSVAFKTFKNGKEEKEQEDTGSAGACSTTEIS